MSNQNMPIRINKYLSDVGICSRREADRALEAGDIIVNGKVADLGMRISPSDEVIFRGKKVPGQVKNEKKVILAFYKPKGIVCTTEKREKDNIVDFIQYPVRIYPVGRLDKESEGLILLTNDGDIVNRINRSGNAHEKEYIVSVNHDVTDFFLRGMANGVPLAELGVTTRKCKVKKIGKRMFSIILTQGYNRQIRRMCDYFGYRVTSLKRIRIMNINLGELGIGKYRELTTDEEKKLRDSIANSSVTPVRKKETKHGRI